MFARKSREDLTRAFTAALHHGIGEVVVLAAAVSAVVSLCVAALVLVLFR